MDTATPPQPWHADYWNGPAGERWARYQAQMDEALFAFGHAMLVQAALRPGQKVLDVGCGCGGTTIQAAPLVEPEGAAVGLDVSAPMLARAGQLSQGVPNIEFVLGDAASHPFPNQFDVVMSRFGLTFFAEPESAFRHLRGLHAPQGMLHFVCWKALEDNEWISVPLGAVSRVLGRGPGRSPSREPGPFAFAEPEYLRGILSSAGFHGIEVSELVRDVVLSTSGLEAAVELVSVHAGPVGRLLAEATADERLRGVDGLRDALRPYLSPSGFLGVPGCAWLVSARKD